MIRGFTISAVAFAVSGAVALSAAADGNRLELDLSSEAPFLLENENRNDGYERGRGVIFFADEAIEIDGAELWTKSTTGLNATFELWEVVRTKGMGILNGATLVRSQDALLIGDRGFHGTKFDPITLTIDQPYYIRVLYDEAADENWFFRYDQNFDPPVDFGPVTVIDGVLSGDATNTVAPFMTLQIVPTPGVTAVFFGLTVFARRRRRYPFRYGHCHDK